MDGINKSSRTWKAYKVTKSLKPNNAITKKTSWDKKREQAMKEKEFKDKLAQMKQEKKDLKLEKLNARKEREQKKIEKERLEILHKRLNQKRIDRLRRKEKRNKALSEGRKR
ncbi:hypothetical protein ACO0OL_002650 [Hanseniaspora opuntiae]|jgi:rRNA-processing protein CGR1|uniref:rRNA-processing protein n=1 Tax=Hanseniaspora opuntiae TaxID=211096 RepID=A0A1E5RCY7_9ASCO|nr:rRNA-processing protein CGR1 [Hanseniaspora opuntiae]